MKKLNLILVGMLLTTTAMANMAVAADTPIPETTMVAAADTAYPTDVENVKAVAGDKLVKLSWDASTDNVGVKGYRIFYGTTSVSGAETSYTNGPIDAGNVLTYEIKNLENDKTYYFAITAYDAAGNESEYYSLEASATPKAGTVAPASDDKTAPKVIGASATYKNTVKVTFSEAVKLPAAKADSAFTIKDDVLNIALAVNKAEMDNADKSGKTVVLTTADQKKNVKYVLTVGIQLQDLAGNPVVSGTSDTAVFSGTDAAQPSTDIKPAAEEDKTAPTLTSVKANTASTVDVTFSEPVVLLANAVENFIITDAADNTKITNVNKVTITQNGTKATLTTDNLSAKKYNLIVLKIKDVAGNTMSVDNSATTFDGVAPVIDKPVDDGKTPETLPTKVDDAASDLMAKAAMKMVDLTWKPKEDKLAGMANFVVYMSTDRGTTYGPGIVLDKTDKAYSFKNLQQDMVYYFKLTTKDAAGNESEGLVTYLTLPKTGPGLLLLLAGSAGSGAWLTRRKKK